MIIGRPFLITLIAVGYIITAIIELFVGISGIVPNFLLGFITSDNNNARLIPLALWQATLGIALFKGWRWAWWLAVLGAYLPIFTHIIGGFRGEQWAWGIILWNFLVIAYMQSRDVQAFFGREAY